MGIEEMIEKYKSIEDNYESNLNLDYYERGVEAGKADLSWRVVEDLEQLKSSLPTQQDKVVVPEFIKRTMEQYGSLQDMLADEYYSNDTEEIDSDKVFCWIDDNFDLLCRAWLDMPKTDVVEVPEFVAEWIEHVKKLHWGIEDVFSPETSNHSVTPLVEEWLTKENAELLARAWLDGYTVEKEQLYYVPVPYIEETYYVINEGGVDSAYGLGDKFTKGEVDTYFPDIKDSAVPVEEDQ